MPTSPSRLCRGYAPPPAFHPASLARLLAAPPAPAADSAPHQPPQTLTLTPEGAALLGLSTEQGQGQAGGTACDTMDTEGASLQGCQKSSAATGARTGDLSVAVAVPFLACGDLHGWDADANYELDPASYTPLAPLQPPTAPAYKTALAMMRAGGR